MSEPQQGNSPEGLRRLLKFVTSASEDPTGPIAAVDPQAEHSRTDVGRRRFLNRALEFAAVGAGLYVIPKVYEKVFSPDASASLTADLEHLSHSLIDFETNFTEDHPLKFWQSWGNAGLRLEQVKDRVTAVPVGPSVLAPSTGMSIGQAHFAFQLGQPSRYGKNRPVETIQPAQFIIRGQDQSNCYVLKIEHDGLSDVPQLIASAERRRGGKRTLVKSEIFSDLVLAQKSGLTVRVEMEKERFAAFIEYEEPGWFSTHKHKPLIRWADPTFSDGQVGLWGTDSGKSRSAAIGEDQRFRVFSVSLKT
jgi:hypothetical protein